MHGTLILHWPTFYSLSSVWLHTQRQMRLVSKFSLVERYATLMSSCRGFVSSVSLFYRHLHESDHVPSFQFFRDVSENIFCRI